MEPIIHYPLSTEKSIRLMEAQNTLIFVVDRKAKKEEIKKALEGLYKVKVQKVRTQITTQGKKRAYVMLAAEYPALDLATQLGLM